MGWSQVSQSLLRQQLEAFAVFDRAWQSNSEPGDCPRGVSQGVWQSIVRDLKNSNRIRELACSGYRQPVEDWIVAFGEIAQLGPKVYQPTAAEWTTFGEIEMRFSGDQYRQPFPTVIVDVPVPLLLNWYSDCDQPVRVSCVTARHRSDGIVVGVIGESEDGLCDLLVFGFPLLPADKTVEEQFANLYEIMGHRGGASFDEVVKIVRSALNACLFLANFGATRIGRNEAVYADLIARSKKKKASEEVRSGYRMAAKFMPDYYRITQDIELRDEVRERQSREEETGKQVSPHWRRAHWVSQRCGVGGKERKLLFRRSSFVNKDKFSGEALDSNYTVKKPS